VAVAEVVRGANGDRGARGRAPTGNIRHGDQQGQTRDGRLSLDDEAGTGEDPVT